MDYEQYEDYVVVQFKALVADGIGDLSTLDFRHDMQDVLDALLQESKLGYCDGGQQGAGSAEIFLYTNDIAACVEIIKKELSRRELLSYCKVASLVNEGDSWVTEYSQHGDFDMWQWKTDQ